VRQDHDASSPAAASALFALFFALDLFCRQINIMRAVLQFRSDFGNFSPVLAYAERARLSTPQTQDTVPRIHSNQSTKNLDDNTDPLTTSPHSIGANLVQNEHIARLEPTINAQDHEFLAGFINHPVDLVGR
jgi:hypothetical protein